MLRTNDLGNEIGKLFWLDEAFKQLIIKETNDFVYNLKGSDAELWVNGGLIVNHQNTRQQMFSDSNDDAPVATS
jgi:hypothetical protein